MRFIISGGWSYGNIGDEAIADATVYLFETFFPGSQFVYTSYDVKDFAEKHPGKMVAASVHKLIGNDYHKFENIVEDSSLLEAPILEEYKRLFSSSEEIRS